jgi:hypothetical protein
VTKGKNPRGASARTYEILAKESAFGIKQCEPYIDFVQKINKIRDDLVEKVDEIKGDGKKIVGFGASAKGNTLLNFANIRLPYIVDDTPTKQGKYSPGMKIPIVPRSTLYKDKPDYVLILAWNFAEEIMEKLSDLDCKFIIPIPEVKEVRDASAI